MRILLYLILIPFLSFSQLNYKIQYDVQLNSFQKKGFLFFNKYSAPHYYEFTPTNPKKVNMSEKDDGNAELRITVENKFEETRRQLYNLKNDTIINVDYIEDEIVTYFDAPKKLNWELINETKNISGYTCSKATTNFRGRKYTAWFTTDIPFRFGPWKFTNSPGLIMEIADESGKFSWYVTKVEVAREPTEFVLDKKSKIVTLKEFVAKNDKNGEELATQMQLKLAPRGTVIEKVTTMRGREKTFEWEEE